nr:hypothetical protein [Tanacetum cinerariifolium]
MLVLQQAVDDVANVAADDVDDKDAIEPTPLSPTPTTSPPPPQELPSTSQVVPTPPPSLMAQPSSPPQQQQPLQPTTISMELLNTLLETCTTLTRRVKNLEQDKIAQALEIIKLKQRVRKLERKNKLKVFGLRRLKKERLKVSQAQVYHIDLKHADKVLSMQVTAATTTVASIITAAPSATRRRKEQAQIEQDEAYVRELEAELNKNINWDDVIEGMSYDDIRTIFEKYFNSNVAFLEKSKEQLEEEANSTLKRKSKSSEQQVAKKKKLDEEVEEMKKHIQIVPNEEDDVYTEATILALKVPVVDYQIHTENNKPYYKIIRADGSHQLFLSFLSLLRNFDKEDLERLWQIVQERFASSKPKNFSDDFLLTTLKAMFEKPDVEAQVWKNQKGIHGLEKVKSWKLLESCGVHLITLITTHMILLVERRYPLTRFTLEQMLNIVRLEVKEESKVSLELLRFV